MPLEAIVALAKGTLKGYSDTHCSFDLGFMIAALDCISGEAGYSYSKGAYGRLLIVVLFFKKAVRGACLFFINFIIISQLPKL